MSFFQGARDVTVSGSTFSATAGRDLSIITINNGSQVGSQSNALKDLSAHAAHAALHNSSARFPASRCHRNTRSSYLDNLEHWMTGQGDQYVNARLIWLTGGAGAGKSAIMQSVVERTITLTVVLGTFFFSRADSSRNHAEVLIPTLAYQLASTFPDVMDVLGPIIERNPLIFKASLETQAYELLVCPLLHLVEIGIVDPTSALRKVFVIDGLDECDDSQKQALIIHTIATVLCDHNLPISVLVASRPEVAIAQAVEKESNTRSVLATITLDANDEAESDIRQFIEDSFQDIIDSHPLRIHIPVDWPSSRSVDKLVWKSSGHFIYAATALKYISSSREHPDRALRVVEGLEASRIGTPFAELDALYTHIIMSATHSTQVLNILRHCTLTMLDTSIATLCYMHPGYSPHEVALFLFDVQALVSLLPNNEGAMFVQVKHASLRDFLRNTQRAGALHVNVDLYKTPLFPRYFQILRDGPRGIYVPPPGFERNAIIYVVRELLNSLIIRAENAADPYNCPRPLDYFELLDLVRNRSPVDIWTFLEYHPQVRLNASSSLIQVSDYLSAIRDLVSDIDEALYVQQRGVFIQLLLNFAMTEPRYSIILAFLFTSSSFSLTWLPPLLLEIYPTPQPFAHHNQPWSTIFNQLAPESRSQTLAHPHPQSWKAIRSYPQNLHDWGLHLVPLLQEVLDFLVNCAWSPMTRATHAQHPQWPRNLLRWECSSRKTHYWHDNAFRRLMKPSSNRNNNLLAQKVVRRRKCVVSLLAVIQYLPKTECTSDLAKLARRSLPLAAAIWYPKKMKEARAAMDAYVRCWEDSLNGISEKTQSMSINEMD